MLAQNSSNLAEMLADPMFTQNIELKDSFTYELADTIARVGKRVIGSHTHRTNIALYGTLSLRGRFYFDNTRFKVAPMQRGINCAWATHTTFTNCSFVSLDNDRAGEMGIWTSEDADNNNSFGIGIDKCDFHGLDYGIRIKDPLNHVVGGWHIAHTDFSSCNKYGIYAEYVAGLSLYHVLFQDNGQDLYLMGNEIGLYACHAERQRADKTGKKLSVFISPQSNPVFFCGGNIANKPARIQDNGKAIYVGIQETKSFLE